MKLFFLGFFLAIPVGDAGVLVNPCKNAGLFGFFDNSPAFYACDPNEDGTFDIKYLNCESGYIFGRYAGHCVPKIVYFSETEASSDGDKDVEHPTIPTTATTKGDLIKPTIPASPPTGSIDNQTPANEVDTTEGPATTENVEPITNEPDTTDAPVTTDGPDTTDEPVSTDEPLTTDIPETTDEPLSTDIPETTDEPLSTDVTATTDEPLPTDIPASTDEPLTTDIPETTDEPLSTDVTATTDEPLPTDIPVSTDEPLTTDIPETTDEPLSTDVTATTDEPLPTDIPASTDEPLTTDIPETTDEPLSTDVTATTDEPISTDIPVTTDVPTSTDNPDITTEEPGSTAPPPFDCPDVGFFPQYGSCEKFAFCAEVNGEIVYYLESCPKGQLFNFCSHFCDSNFDCNTSCSKAKEFPEKRQTSIFNIFHFIKPF